MTEDAAAAVLAAITTGVTSGSGERTPGEWIAGPIATGLTALADTIAPSDQKGRMITCRPA